MKIELKWVVTLVCILLAWYLGRGSVSDFIGYGFAILVMLTIFGDS